MKNLWTVLVVMALALLAWAIQERLPIFAAVGRVWRRVYRSAAFINAVVLVCAALPVIGVVAAFWTGDWRWLVLLFFLAPFLA